MIRNVYDNWQSDQADDLQAGDAFGRSMGVSLDTAVIGAPFDDFDQGGPKTDGGTAFVYRFVGIFEDGFESSDTAAWTTTVP